VIVNVRFYSLSILKIILSSPKWRNCGIHRT